LPFLADKPKETFLYVSRQTSGIFLVCRTELPLVLKLSLRDIQVSHEDISQHCAESSVEASTVPLLACGRSDSPVLSRLLVTLREACGYRDLQKMSATNTGLGTVTRREKVPLAFVQPFQLPVSQGLFQLTTTSEQFVHSLVQLTLL
jgi:hypothetical protein